MFSMVTVLLKPYHLRGRLRDSLGRAVQWAAQRKGQQQQTAEQVYTIYGGQLRNSLGRAVQWAAQRKGQLQQTAEPVSTIYGVSCGTPWAELCSGPPRGRDSYNRQ